METKTTIPNKQRAREVYAEMLASSGSAKDAIKKLGLESIDEGKIRDILRQAIAANAKAVADFKAGKTKAADAIKGAVMRQTKGMAKPDVVQKLLLEELEKDRPDAALEAVEEAIRAHLVDTEGKGRQTRYRFVHELLRQTLSETLDQVRIRYRNDLYRTTEIGLPCASWAGLKRSVFTFATQIANSSGGPFTAFTSLTSPDSVTT